MATAEYDVFLSHAWKDGERPQQIADALTKAGLRVWFDANEIDDFTSITHAVTEGLAKSKALVSYYSKTYPLRRACQWDLTAAFLAAQTEGDPRRRVLTCPTVTKKASLKPCCAAYAGWERKDSTSCVWRRCWRSLRFRRRSLRLSSRKLTSSATRMRRSARVWHSSRSHQPRWLRSPARIRDARSVHTLVSRAVRFHEKSAPERTQALRAAAVVALRAEIAKVADDPRIRCCESELHAAHARQLVTRVANVY